MLWLKSLQLLNFRNYEETAVDFVSDINLITGHNASGKTNLLEAIYYLSSGRSHRRHQDRDVILRGKSFFKVQGYLKKSDYDYKIELANVPPRKILKINNKFQKRISSLLYTFPAVVFTPEDLILVKGPPLYRRHFLDLLISRFDYAYFSYLNDYSRVLKQRNQALKDQQINILKLWDEQFCSLAVKIILTRQETLSVLNSIVKEYYCQAKWAGEKLELIYNLSGFNNNNMDRVEKEELIEIFRASLSNIRERELKRGYTLIGPHRDDLYLFLNNEPLKILGSQGQQRTAVLALKLAETKYLSQVLDEYPVLLLDDVFSELDEKRKSGLVSLIKGKMQAFITAVNESYLKDLPMRAVYRVETKGKIKKIH